MYVWEPHKNIRPRANWEVEVNMPPRAKEWDRGLGLPKGGR